MKFSGPQIWFATAPTVHSQRRTDEETPRVRDLEWPFPQPYGSTDHQNSHGGGAQPEEAEKGTRVARVHISPVPPAFCVLFFF